MHHHLAYSFMPIKLRFTILLFAVTLFVASCSKTQSNENTAATGTAASASGGITANQQNFTLAMRKLWEDHVMWTRNVIFCLVDKLPGTNQDLARLMKNQEDIGNAIVPYYGKDAGEKLTGLLKTHIAESADVVHAAMANDKNALDAANAKWNANADSIATFLSGANPKLAADDMKKMMHDHLKLTTDEAVARIKKNYDADVKAYDAVHNEILKMSDMLAAAIIAQFPDKF